MTGLFGWPQVTTAAAFVTAVAVVLNPITPGLPDVTVPALFPLDSARGATYQAAPSSVGTPVPAASAGNAAPVTVAPVRYPAVLGPSAPSAVPWRGTVPAYIPTPPAPTIAAVQEMPVEIDSIPTGLDIGSPVRVPVVQVADPTAGIPFTGDRPRTQITRPTVVVLPSGNRPRPAAAVDPETATPGQPESPEGPGVRARVPASPAGPSVRGHRGPVDRE